MSEDQVPNRIDVQVGDSIELLGYAIEGSEPEEGSKLHAEADKPQALDVTLYWQAHSPVNENYHIFVQLLDPEGRLVTQHDGQPLHGYLPTGDWAPDEVVPDRHRLPLPDDLPYGHYQLISGMYLPETLERLPVYAAHLQSTSDNVTLTQLEIGD